jgi:large subunit ribosomal protein L7/L12
MTDLAKIVDDLSKLTVLEAAELAKLLEEKWGVSAAAPVAFAPGAAAPGGGAAAPAAEEQTEFTVVLKSGGDKKLNVIKEVRSIVSGLGIKEAKELVEAGGKVIKEGVTKEEAAKIKKQLEDQGAVVEVK